jgi:hypothetical protein
MRAGKTTAIERPDFGDLLPPVGVERTTLVTLCRPRSAGWLCLAPESAGDLFPEAETLYVPHRPVKCLVPGTFSVACATQMPLAESDVPGSIFEKSSYPGAPLRNRTVDLLLTMSHRTVPLPQARRLTRQNASKDWHLQAPDRPAQAPFATQSATQFGSSTESSPARICVSFR